MSVYLIVLLAAVGLPLLWALVLYNRLVAYRNECRSALAQVDVQLKRRHDLLPKLEAVVKGAMQYEAGTLEAVARLRQEAGAAAGLGERLRAEAGLGRLLGGLLLRMEAYPALQAVDNALELQRELSGTEDRIAFSRTYYNDVCANYNILIQAVPALFLARAFGFGPQPWFREDGQA